MNIKKILMTLVLSTILIGGQLFITAQAKSPNETGESVEPNTIEICSVYKDHHEPNRTSLIKYADSIGGTIYNGSSYTCACGKIVYCSNERNDLYPNNIYWFEGEMHEHGKYYLPGYVQYMVPNKIYYTTDRCPPNWTMPYYLFKNN